MEQYSSSLRGALGAMRDGLKLSVSDAAAQVTHAWGLEQRGVEPLV